MNAALEAGVVAVQYRDKFQEHERRMMEALRLREWCERHGALLIINDDYSLAHAVDAHGVHLGAHDASVVCAREALGPNALIGVSCYNELERARVAQQSGASAIAFGAFYPSPTKPEAVRAPLELIEQAKPLGLPIIGIGGISVNNAKPLIEAGIDNLAVISEIFDASNPYAAAKALVDLFDSSK